MVEKRVIAVGLVAVATIVALIALVAPWWTLSAFIGEMSNSQSAGPFNSNDDLISTGSAVLTGVLTLLGLLALAGATALLGYSLAANTNNALTKNAPLIAFAGIVLLLVSLVLAIFMYPAGGAIDGEMGFWDSEGGEGMSASTFAAWGWYMAVAAVVLGTAGAFLAITEATTAPASRSESEAV